MISKIRASLTIISGGQTGADAAALDWAIRSSIPHGGYCPKGRRCESGIIPAEYHLLETTTANPCQRTRLNVQVAQATVIFTPGAELTGGSRLTEQYCQLLGRPYLHLTQEEGLDSVAGRLRAFLLEYAIRVLNVAGSRASKAPNIGNFVQAVLDSTLGGGHATPAP